MRTTGSNSRRKIAFGIFPTIRQDCRSGRTTGRMVRSFDTPRSRRASQRFKMVHRIRSGRRLCARPSSFRRRLDMAVMLPWQPQGDNNALSVSGTLTRPPFTMVADGVDRCWPLGAGRRASCGSLLRCPTYQALSGGSIGRSPMSPSVAAARWAAICEHPRHGRRHSRVSSSIHRPETPAHCSAPRTRQVDHRDRRAP